MSHFATPRARLELLLLLSTLLLGVVAVRRWQWALTPPAFARTTALAALSEPTAFDGDSLAAAANATIDNDPFRLANAPADVRYDPRRAGTVPPTPAAPKIALVLKAIVGGPPWQAMIDGIPGRPGAVVRSGDTFDKLVIRTVTRDTVVVQSPDTTWKLTIKRG